MAVKFIAEIGSNHNRSLDRTYRLIEAAKDCGFDAVKFQLFTADTLYRPEFQAMRDAVRGRELPPSFLADIRNACLRVGIEFHCTPFTVDEAKFLAFFVDEFKIASSSILCLDLIRACADTGKFVAVSMGCATAPEKNDVAMMLTRAGAKFCFYYCVPDYPASSDKLRLPDFVCSSHMQGYSDHTAEPAAIYAAVARGARRVEMHFDLNDGEGRESVHGHCWTAAEARDVILTAHDVDAILFGWKIEESNCVEVRNWRNDPDDYMRPLKDFRAKR